MLWIVAPKPAPFGLATGRGGGVKAWRRGGGASFASAAFERLGGLSEAALARAFAASIACLFCSHSPSLWFVGALTRSEREGPASADVLPVPAEAATRGRGGVAAE